MSSVTASVLIGGSPPYRGGVEVAWTAFLHEGASAAWQISPINTHWDTPETATFLNRRDLWIQCHDPATILDLLRVGIHLRCTPADNAVARLLRDQLAGGCISEHDRIDISALPSAHQHSILRLARTSPGLDTTVMLSVYHGSSLRGTGAAFFATPGWQGEWAETSGGRLFRTLPQDWHTWAES